MGTNKLIWLPRILTIVFILFLSLFSLDVFGMEASFLRKIGGFLVHNIPSFLLILVLAVFWKRPLISGLGFILFGLLTIPFFGTYKELAGFLLITLAPLAIGGLFLLSRRTRGKEEMPAR